MQDRSKRRGIESRLSRTPSAASKAGSRALFAFTTASLTLGLGAAGGGCLNRPVESQAPTTKTNFTTNVRAAGVDKLDLLFAIDNSASMGDKQELLGAAVPDLIGRLINPNCVSTDVPDGGTPAVLSQSANGKCPAGKLEFPPVHDLHIGIVSSSLGGLTSDPAQSYCPDNANNPLPPQFTGGKTLDTHYNDHGHLINRSGEAETPVPDAGVSNFLAWLPTDPKNVGKPPPGGNAAAIGATGTFSDGFSQLDKDFIDLVSGVHEYGCGFEAQLESVYHFLVQPDPYLSVTTQGSRAQLNGIDADLLQQRHDFLRPDSLVAVIMISDETDSTVDPLSVNGQGWAFLAKNFPGSATGQAPKGTSQCAINPLDPLCTSCGFGKRLADGSWDPNDAINQDANCKDNHYYSPIDDNANVRPIRMKQRFGIDPQFPISRYVNGFQNPRVPNRFGEHPLTTAQQPSSSYIGTPNCVNPLYAASLPTLNPSASGYDETKAISDTLCNLEQGTRDPSLVFYAMIGGVPWQLLAVDPNASVDNVKIKDTLSDADWNKLIGKDPVNFDFTGIDPHMIESTTPRDTLPPPTSADNTDPFNGREWITLDSTGYRDIEFACTFPFPKSKLPDGKKDCTLDQYKNACDCNSDLHPPLCDPNTPTTQIRGKAYPTRREFTVARAMGNQGIVSSICPIKSDLDPMHPLDPNYGYRPAVTSIINRLANSLSSSCLPQPLNRFSDNTVPCLVLETLGADGPETNCNDAANYPGRSIPDADILAKVREGQKLQAVSDGGVNLLQRPVCQLKELPTAPGETCADNLQDSGWCYVTGPKAGGSCTQSIFFTANASKANGSVFALQCIKSSDQTDGGAAAAPSTTNDQ